MRKKLGYFSFFYFIVIIAYLAFGQILYESTTNSNLGLVSNYRKFNIFLTGPYDEAVERKFINEISTNSNLLSESTLVFNHNASNSLAVISDVYKIPHLTDVLKSKPGEVYVRKNSLAYYQPEIFGIESSQIKDTFENIKNKEIQIIYDYNLKLFPIEGSYLIASDNPDVLNQFEKIIKSIKNYDYVLYNTNLSLGAMILSNPAFALMTVGFIITSLVYLFTFYNMIKSQYTRLNIYHLFGASKKKRISIIMKETIESLVLTGVLASVISHIIFGNLLRFDTFALVICITITFVLLLSTLLIFPVLLLQSNRGVYNE